MRKGAGARAPRPPTTSTPVLRAFDKTTGETIHSVELNVPPTGAPMTYLVNGKQHIIMAYGNEGSSGLIALAVP